jgi:hypothetical protein
MDVSFEKIGLDFMFYAGATSFFTTAIQINWIDFSCYSSARAQKKN